MNIKRAILITMAAIMLPAGALIAQDIPQPQPGDALFFVNKTFFDGNDETAVTIRMQCNHGNPTQQQVTIVPEAGRRTVEVGFVVTNISPDVTFTCEIWEDTVPGYEAGYRCNGEGSAVDCRGPRNGEDLCTFDGVVQDQVNACRINNVPLPVDVDITKEWVYPRDGGEDIPQEVDITLYCYSEIVGGYFNRRGGYWYDTQTVVGNGTAEFSVIPRNFDGNSCWVSEDIEDSAVEQTDNCGNLSVRPGVGDSCTITNTVFFEGIPTLSQYGLAIMALLMLGIGFVGFRRFV